MSEDIRDAIIANIEKEFGKLMRKVAYQVLNDWHEVEDVMQMVFCELIFKHLDKLNLPQIELRRYLCTAVRNTAINAYQKKSKVDTMDPFMMNQLTENQIDIASFQDQFGLGEEVRELLKSLNSVDADIIRLKFSGFTYAEIAGAVGKREDNVRKRMERAKKKLQTIILDREVEENDR